MSRVVALISALLALGLASFVAPSAAQATGNPNLVIWGYDIWRSDIGAYSHGLIGFKTSNIDHFVNGEQSCNGDRDEFPPTAHGFHAFLYHLYARGEPELPSHRKDPAYSAKFGPRRSTMPSERAARRGRLRDELTFGVVLELIQEAGNPYFDWVIWQLGTLRWGAGVLGTAQLV